MINQEGEEIWREKFKFIEIKRKAYKGCFLAELFSLKTEIWLSERVPHKWAEDSLNSHKIYCSYSVGFVTGTIYIVHVIF